MSLPTQGNNTSVAMAAEGVFVSLNECTTLLVKHLPNGGSEMERKAGRERERVGWVLGDHFLLPFSL
jgi:hypothetical protein